MYQQGVTFHYHNLVRHPFPSLAHNLVAFDIILCRNVLIYFAPEVAQRTIAQLGQCLVPGGWLAVGYAENGGHYFNDFETVSVRGATLHRKPLATPCPSTAGRADRRLSTLSAQHKRSKSGHATALSAVRKSLHGHGRPAVKRLRKPQAFSTDLGIERIRALCDQGDVDGALKLCHSLAAKQPLNAILHFYSGLLLDQEACHSAAAHALGRAVYLDRDFVLAHYYLGIVQQKMADAAGASRSFRNVKQLLEGLEPTASLPNADGLKVADLNELASMHLESLKAV
jgi:chemotaxis protein methyltransferase CheR